MAFGLLAGNVFLVHTASNNNLGSLKMVEVKRETPIMIKVDTYFQLASKNIGCIMMFLGMIVFNSLGIDKVSLEILR